MIYKACGNRRESVCPSCAQTYQRDAYQLVRAGLVGGKGVPADVATHSSLFVTFTAPGFGPVHTRAVTTHTCAKRRQCDCRAEPCHPGRADPCPHGQPAVCFARPRTRRHPRSAAAVPGLLRPRPPGRVEQPGRRTVAAHHHGHHPHLRRTAKNRGVDPKTVKVSYGKVAEMQRRGVVHFHAVIRLDGADPDRPDRGSLPAAGRDRPSTTWSTRSSTPPPAPCS